MPREQAWDYLIQPEFRNTLICADELNVTNRTNGRTAPGSVFQFYHGDKILPQTVLECQPFNSMIVEERFHRSIAVSWLAEYTLKSFEGGTRLTRRNSKPTGSILGRTILFLLSPGYMRVVQPFFTAFAQRIEEDYRARGGVSKSGTEVTGEQIRKEAGVSLQESAS